MNKSKFYKNLYQAISFFSVIMIFAILLLSGFMASLSYESDSNWILAMLAIFLIVLYFLVGFYWIFQKVEFEAEGIKITILGRNIRKIKWEDIEEIKYTSIMRNPAYVLKIKESKNLNLDGRKKIKDALLVFGNEKIKKQLRQV